jgi:ABC-type sugar transport system permease subunit
MKGAVRPPAQGSPAVNWLYALPALSLMALVNVVPIGQSFFYARGWGRLSSHPRLWTVLNNPFSFPFAIMD